MKLNLQDLPLYMSDDDNTSKRKSLHPSYGKLNKRKRNQGKNISDGE